MTPGSLLVTTELIVFAFSDNLSEQNSKLSAESGLQGLQLLECVSVYQHIFHILGTFRHILVHSQFLGRLINKTCTSPPCLLTQAACHLTKACFIVYLDIFDPVCAFSHIFVDSQYLKKLANQTYTPMQILDLFDHQLHMG